MQDGMRLDNSPSPTIDNISLGGVANPKVLNPRRGNKGSFGRIKIPVASICLLATRISRPQLKLRVVSEGWIHRCALETGNYRTRPMVVLLRYAFNALRSCLVILSAPMCWESLLRLRHSARARTVRVSKHPAFCGVKSSLILIVCSLLGFLS